VSDQGTDETALDEAAELNDRGRELADEDDLDGAAGYYRKAIDRLPTYEPAWFNLGLVHKFRCEWAPALECNRKAAELGGEEGDPAWWNLGIAATALRDWDTARAAWRAFGIEVEGDDGEIREDYGPAPIRLRGESGEVVWCLRIDPARAVVRNVPLPGSGHRFGDIVLHDGAPNGERVLGEEVFGVFDELERWQASDVPTLRVDVVVTGDLDGEALSELFDEAGYAAQDWSTTVVPLCRACSEGQVHAAHEHEAASRAATAERIFGIGAPPEEAVRLLRLWEAGDPSRRRHGDPVLVG
jgi:hypothetical protein